MDSNQIDKIQDISIVKEMKSSYIEYAMSVIVSRALPDVRDGLKPVHRRILYSMSELNLDPSKPYKKSARIVGDTMGKYHPHGDSAIYDAMVRMAQDFSMRYMLVDGHGNFGSVDGDGAAAPRYTEARLSKIAMHMLTDIDKDTVDYRPNYTEEFNEPTVLPARFPNLLVNGSSGIAVGMATNIPPHNLTEVINAIIKLIDNYVEEDRETELSELMEIITGPDFPTAGNILGKRGIKEAYETGRGKVILRANAEIKELGNKNVIVIDELPYQVNKARLQERMAELVRDKRIEGISDIRDESDRNGMHLVIELKRDANPNVVLNNLYKYTQMQETFGVIMLALVNNEPKVLNLKEVLVYYLEHQKEVERRRTQFELLKAEKRAHILEGFIIALDNIDKILNIIRKSPNVNIAKESLIQEFSFSDEQVSAIVDMRFRSLTGLEREKTQSELEALIILMTELKNILENEHKLYEVIKEDLINIKSKFGDERRTKIIFDSSNFDMEDLIEDEMNVVTMSILDYIKRVPLTTYKSQNRGGRGIIGMQTREEDIVSNLFVTNTHSDILFLTNKGRIYQIKTYQVPEVSRTAKGTAIVNLLNLDPDEKIAASFPITIDKKDDSEQYLMMITKNGTVKKTELKRYYNIMTKGIIAININDGDELKEVLLTTGNDYVFISTKKGLGIKFHENSVRSTGRNTTGVRGIRLNKNDEVIGATLVEDDSSLLFVSSKGYGKRTLAKHFRIQGRGGKGSISYKVNDKTGDLISVNKIQDTEELMLISSEGIIIRIRAKEISETLGRNTSGVKLINLEKSVTVKGIAKISEEDLEAEEEDIEFIIEEGLEEDIEFIEEDLEEEDLEKDLEEEDLEKDLEKDLDNNLE